jgi:hypothetical protein
MKFETISLISSYEFYFDISEKKRAKEGFYACTDRKEEESLSKLSEFIYFFDCVFLIFVLFLIYNIYKSYI